MTGQEEHAGATGYRGEVMAAIRDPERFVRATFSGLESGVAPWQRVTLRPVELKGERHIQFAYYDARQCVTKNYRGEALGERAAELLALPFRSITVESTTGTLQVQRTAKGRTLVHRGGARGDPATPDLAHDRRKPRALPADRPDAYLQEVGIMTADGHIRADRQHKFRQVNEFLRLVEQTVEQAGGLSSLAGSDGLSVVDCGCGNAYLTFAIYHYFAHVQGVPVTLTGLDVNDRLLAGHEEKVRRLGWPGLTFEATPIIAYTPERPPDIVLALHACDTATDEALAQAIRWESRLIFSVPCCHHHLQAQLDPRRVAAPLRPLLRHGILGERQGDVLTDTFRALLLQGMGYQTDVIEFVEAEHTTRNLMLRAIRRGQPGDPRVLREYADLKALWRVTPRLEELLGDDHTRAATPSGETTPDGHEASRDEA